MTDSADGQDISEELRELATRFLAKLPDRLDEIRKYLDDHIKGNSLPVDSLYELHRLIHALAGTAGTYGYTEIGLKLRDLDADLKEQTHSHKTPLKQENITGFREGLSAIGMMIEDSDVADL